MESSKNNFSVVGYCSVICSNCSSNWITSVVVTCYTTISIPFDRLVEQFIGNHLVELHNYQEFTVTLHSVKKCILDVITEFVLVATATVEASQTEDIKEL